MFESFCSHRFCLPSQTVFASTCSTQSSCHPSRPQLPWPESWTYGSPTVWALCHTLPRLQHSSPEPTNNEAASFSNKPNKHTESAPTITIIIQPQQHVHETMIGRKFTAYQLGIFLSTCCRPVLVRSYQRARRPLHPSKELQIEKAAVHTFVLSRMVLILCAMVSVVADLKLARMVRWMRASVSPSTLAVASSATSTCKYE